MEIDSDHVKLSLKQELVNVYNRHKFPLTVEPLVFLASLAFGLNEVTSETIALDKLSISGDQIKFVDPENLSEQVEL